MLSACLMRNDEGTTAVEFAVVAMAFMVMVMGIFEMGRAFYIWNTFQYAVENATRYALVQDEFTNQDLEDFVAEQMGMINIESNLLTVSVNEYDLSGVNFVEVAGSYTFSAIAPFLPDKWNNFTLSASSRLPIP